MDVVAELNKDVVTEFPLDQAVGKLQPGLYLIAAKPWTAPKPAGAEQENVDQLATQWMVISDLGLTTLSGDDGIHAIVRSLSTAAPLAGVELRLIARNNEVLATKTTDAQGRVDFDPGLNRGTGGAAPGVLVATLADDYGFLNLTQGPFDLTDRGVAGRDAPATLDAFLYTERGVYRSGETVYVAALLRDAKGAAKSGLPLTLVVKRPDGVEYKRAASRTRASAAGRSACRSRPRRWRGPGRSTPSPIPRRRRSAMRNSCWKTMFRSGSTIS